MEKTTPRDDASATRRRITLELSLEKLTHIDALKREWGLRNRGDVLERLLGELFATEAEEEAAALAPPSPVETSEQEVSAERVGSLDDSAALVLVGGQEQRHRSSRFCAATLAAIAAESAG